MKKIIYRRIIAFLIDSIFISLIVSLLSGFITIKISLGKFHAMGRDWVVIYQIYFIVVVLYFLTFDTINHGTTVGKKIMHIKVISEIDNNAITQNRSILRSLIKSISTTLPIISLIYYVFKHVTIQDFISKTKTIST